MFNFLFLFIQLLLVFYTHCVKLKLIRTLNELDTVDRNLNWKFMKLNYFVNQTLLTRADV